jgi:tetratricopeptide (TPR) repeat protein
MKTPLPRWLLYTLIGLAVLVIVGLIIFLYRVSPLAGGIVTGVLVVVLAIIALTVGPQLYKLYKFQKYFKAHEETLKLLGTLMAAGRTQEAVMRMEELMKNAPENAITQFMRAMFLERAGKYSEAMSAAGRALTLAKKDPMLPAMLQEMKNQPGLPGSMDEFREQMEEMRTSLEPRVNQMRQRKEKAKADRKKKSR